MKYFIDALKRYVEFDGRATKQEYWMFVLWYWIFFILTYFIGIFTSSDDSFVKYFTIGIPSYILMFGTLIPSLAIASRRLHDINKSGWLQLVIIIPLVGIIWLLVLLCKTGIEGTNKFGEEPSKG